MKRVLTVWTGIPGTPFLTTCHFDGETLNSDAVSAMAGFWTDLAAEISQELTWTVQGNVEGIDPATGDLTSLGDVQADESGSGASPSDLLSLGTCGQLNLTASGIVNGKRLRGRLYIPGPTEGATSEGIPGPTYRSALTTAFDTMQGAVSGGFVIWHRPSPGGSDGEDSPVATATASSYFARLTSRQR